MFNIPGTFSSLDDSATSKIDHSHLNTSSGTVEGLKRKDLIYVQEAGRSPAHYALWLRQVDGSDFMLPIALNLARTRSWPLIISRPWTSGSVCEYPWDIASDAKLRKHFNGFPVLQLTDTISLLSLIIIKFFSTLAEPGKDAQEYWGDEGLQFFHPRVLTEWFLTPRVERDIRVLSQMFEYSEDKKVNSLRCIAKGLHQFTKPALLVGEVFRLQCRAQWKGRESVRSFELNSVDRFDIKPPDSLPNVANANLLEMTADNAISCQICHDCTQPTVSHADIDFCHVCQKYLDRC